MKTKENDERRRREHDDAQRKLQVQCFAVVAFMSRGLAIGGSISALQVCSISIFPCCLFCSELRRKNVSSRSHGYFERKTTPNAEAPRYILQIPGLVRSKTTLMSLSGPRSLSLFPVGCNTRSGWTR